MPRPWPIARTCQTAQNSRLQKKNGQDLAVEERDYLLGALDQHLERLAPAHKGTARVVMVYVLMACTVMACIVMAYIVMALNSTSNVPLLRKDMRIRMSAEACVRARAQTCVDECAWASAHMGACMAICM